MTDLRHESDDWIAEHGRFLRRLARAVLADESRAEDASQDAWVAALDTPPPRQLAGWLVTVTRRLARRSDRDAARRRAREEDVARAESVPAADSVVARAEIVRTVGQVVADLPEPFRETLLLRYWEGLPPRDIAARTGVPVATVQSRTRRGLERVRAELERRAPRERRWEDSLALAAGLCRPGELAGASTFATTLGALTMKTATSTWIAGACALLALTAALAVGITALGPDGPRERGPRALPAPPDVALVAPAIEMPEVSEAPAERLAAPAVTAPASEALRSLAVRVVDAAGRAVGGAELLAGASAADLRPVGTTGGDGRARLALAPDARRLLARAAGWAPSPVYERPPDERAPGEPGEHGEQGELVLQLPLRGVPFTVEVRGPAGAPLAGARVVAGREEEVDYRLPDGTLAKTVPGLGATTDAAGVARFPGLSPGWVRVRVEHETHAAATAFATLELERENRLEVALAPGISVTGQVRDERGRPIAGARVERSSSGRAVTSAADGSFRLGPVAAGKIVVVGPAGRRVERRLNAAPGAAVRWDPVLPSEPALRGRLVDARGVPQAGWWVHANFDTWPGWRRGTRTGADGSFAIHGTPDGGLRVEVRAEEDAPLPLLTRDGIEAGAEELLLELPAVACGSVTGRVDRPLEDAAGDAAGALPLFLRHRTAPDRQRLTGGPGRPVPLDGDGRFTLDDVPAGSYELVLEGTPYGWFRLARLEVDAGLSSDLGRIAAPETGTLRARTWWGGTEPGGVASYLLERRADNVTLLSFRGAFPEELALAPGTYTLQTEVTPGPQREVEFEIRPGQVTPIELDLAATCAHVVRVRYASGRTPVGRVVVEVRLAEEDLEVLSSDVSELDDGAWTVEVDLASGRFEFVARDAAGRAARATENLFTSRPGREVVLVFDDEGESR